MEASLSQYFSNASADADMLLAVEITGPYLFQIVARVLHIVSAVILVGGLFYLRSVLAPAGPDACFADRRAIWAKWVGISTLFLIVSGIYNFILIMNAAKGSGVKLPPTYHMLFGIKVLLATAVMFIAAILAGKTEAAERFRGNMRRWLNIGWLASLAIIVIAAILRTLH